MLYKIRQIRTAQISERRNPVFGITVPKDVAEQYSGTYFRFSIHKNGLTLHSGAQPTKAEVEE